jgi:murein DD-endopeptidase MepM/ murein hydrolase activator NlpD
VYGSQRVYNGVPKSPHYGVDYAGPEGALVIAPSGGVVVLAEIDLFYSGGTLIIDHGHGLSSSFLHLSEILVAKGDSVQSGEPIAKIGATGRATGPHLDWRMNWKSVRIDPQLVLQVLPE